MSRHRTKIIVVEGPDRCGKATQAQLLKEHLEGRGKTATVVEVPIKDGFIYHIIYWMLRNGLAKKFPKLFQWLQCYNRLIFQWLNLPRLSRRYDYIIFDRWSLSSVIYGLAEGIDRRYCEKLYRRLRRPDFTLLLLGESYAHEAEDVYEADHFLQGRVRLLYAEWHKSHPTESFVFEDTGRSKQEIAADVINVLINKGIIPT
jgi:dTMP kinase